MINDSVINLFKFGIARYLSIIVSIIRTFLLYAIYTNEEYGLIALILVYNELGVHFTFGSKLYLISNSKTYYDKFHLSYVYVNMVSSAICIIFAVVIILFESWDGLIKLCFVLMFISQYCRGFYLAELNTFNKSKIIGFIELTCNLYLFCAMLIIGLVLKLSITYYIFFMTLANLPFIFLFAKRMYYIKKNKLNMVFPKLRSLLSNFSLEFMFAFAFISLRLQFQYIYGYKDYGQFSFLYSAINNITMLIALVLYYFQKNLFDLFNRELRNEELNEIFKKSIIIKVGLIILFIVSVIVFHGIKNYSDLVINSSLISTVYSIFYFKLSSAFFRTYHIKIQKNFLIKCYTLILMSSWFTFWYFSIDDLNVIPESNFLLIHSLIFMAMSLILEIHFMIKLKCIYCRSLLIDILYVCMACVYHLVNI